MKKSHTVLISLGLMILMMTILFSACGSSNASAPGSSSSSTSTPLDGRALLQQRCSVCHGTNQITRLKGTSDQWASLVDVMVAKGAQLSNTERQTLVDYLSQLNQ